MNGASKIATDAVGTVNSRSNTRNRLCKMIEKVKFCLCLPLPYNGQTALLPERTLLVKKHSERNPGNSRSPPAGCGTAKE